MDILIICLSAAIAGEFSARLYGKYLDRKERTR